ncbi:P1 family peptidase [Ilumatobacter sp.]|uniref:P1 family peptidase n=1 Tax=Ilumatobacter sp. TaxID=1967498 RepID=UPI003B523ECE
MDVTPFGSILDVDGVGVGHHQRTGRGWQSGTTVVTVAAGATPGVNVRGGGPGTRETDALRPENLVRTIHAITLTGGSAYGLASADGVVAVLEERGLGFPIRDHVVPVVPAAVIFDLGRGGSFANRPDRDFGARAARAALSARSTPRWGAVGAGTGARAGGLQGGVGTASTIVDTAVGPITVGAVAVVNANGSVIDPRIGLPWEIGPATTREVSAAELDAVRTALGAERGAELNTTIGVVATSAALDKAECSKVAAVAHDGLARAVRPAHAMTDGDTVFTVATGETAVPAGHRERVVALNLLLVAAADTFALACTHAVVAATTVGDAPAHADLVPDALRIRTA